MCSSRIFMCSAGMRHCARSRSNSPHFTLLSDHLGHVQLEAGIKALRIRFMSSKALVGKESAVVNHKRVERLYAEARLQVRRRKRKKIPIADRQPLDRPRAANQVWSMGFVFDRTAEEHVMNILTMVDDATHEAVAIVPERTIGGLSLTRILDASGHVTRSAQSHPHG